MYIGNWGVIANNDFNLYHKIEYITTLWKLEY